MSGRRLPVPVDFVPVLCRKLPSRKARKGQDSNRASLLTLTQSTELSQCSPANLLQRQEVTCSMVTYYSVFTSRAPLSTGLPEALHKITEVSVRDPMCTLPFALWVWPNHSSPTKT